MKIVSREELVRQKIVTRFEQEIRVVKTLNHPNIIKIYEVIYDTNNIYVIMEYCKLGELYNFIVSHGPLSPNDARPMFRQLLEAVHYIHEHKVSHRDIKLENILLDEQMVPKLADFGLCHSLAYTQLLATPCGTLIYAPPEVISNNPYDGMKCDIWSLGIVFFAVVLGRLPWKESNQNSLFAEISKGQITIPQHLDQPLRQMLSMMLDRDPTNRADTETLMNLQWMTEEREEIVLKTSTSLYMLKGKKLLFSNDDSISAINKRSSVDSCGKKPLIIRPNPPNSKHGRDSITDIKIPLNVIRKVPPRTINKSPIHSY